MERLIPRLTSLAAFALGGCSLITDSFVVDKFSGDEFPIEVETASGAIVLGLRQDGEPDRTAVLDLLSPLTIIDSGPNGDQSLTTATLTLLGEEGAGGVVAQPRARLDDAQLVSLHPCAPGVSPCIVGTDALPQAYDAIIGADVLAGDDIRLRLGDDQIFILPDVGGDEEHRSRTCDGVFGSPYRGGGTLLLGGTEVEFGGRRIALGTCLGPDPSPGVTQAYRGADALFVVSTSIGTSLIGEAAYLRYLTAHPCPATTPRDPSCPIPLAELPPGTVNLPSGPVAGRLVTLPELALVASSSSDQRAPCRAVYASHFLTARDCVLGTNGDADCPCDEDTSFCSTPAVLHLSPPTGIEMLVIADDNKTLQALRTELRPNQPEVDGILGTQALRTTELDIDYPHNRMLARCTDPGCIARPRLSERSDRTQVTGCLRYTPPGPAFPAP